MLTTAFSVIIEDLCVHASFTHCFLVNKFWNDFEMKTLLHFWWQRCCVNVAPDLSGGTVCYTAWRMWWGNSEDPPTHPAAAHTLDVSPSSCHMQTRTRVFPPCSQCRVAWEPFELSSFPFPSWIHPQHEMCQGGLIGRSAGAALPGWFMSLSL